MYRKLGWFLVISLVFPTRILSNIEVKCNSDNILQIYCNFDNMEQSKRLDDGDYQFFYCDSSSFQNATYISFPSCEKLPYIPQQFFHKLPAVKSVNLQDSGIESIKSGDFGDNKYLDTIWMSINRLAELPAYLFVYSTQVEEVDFSRNQISKIHGTALDGAINLKIIDLSSNQLKTLDENLFNDTTALKKLDLSHNLLENFSPNLLKLSKLHKLALNDNKLVQLDCRIFPTSANLWIDVDASSNELELIDLDCGTKCHGYRSIFLNICHNKLESLLLPNSSIVNSLITLRAANNQIENISIESKLIKLRHLDVANNKLKNIWDIFRHCTGLEELNLSYNDIRVLHANSFEEMTNLEFLFLQSANLTSIESGTFARTRNLIFLDLSHNKLKKIDFDPMVTDFDQLNKLLLNDNYLKEVNGWWNPTFSSLRELAIGNNLFNCSYMKDFLPTISARIHLISSVHRILISCIDDSSILPAKTNASQHNQRVSTLRMIKYCIIFGCIVCTILILSVVHLIILRAHERTFAVEYNSLYSRWNDIDSHYSSVNMYHHYETVE